MAAHPQRLVPALATDGERVLEGIAAEVLPLADACRFLERNAARLLAPQRLGRRGRPSWLFGLDAEVRREPLGVVLVIAPNNYPLLLPGVPALQALAAGNAVLVKPAPGCSRPVVALGEMLAEAGLPAALFQVLGEDVAEATAAIEGGVDHVVLTGSAATGRSVLAALAPRLTPATLELSGNDAVFVLPGADLDMVADALAFGLRFNASFHLHRAAPGVRHRGRCGRARVEAGGAPGRSAVAADPRRSARDQVARLVAEAAAAGARFLPERPEVDAPTSRRWAQADGGARCRSAMGTAARRRLRAAAGGGPGGRHGPGAGLGAPPAPMRWAPRSSDRKRRRWSLPGGCTPAASSSTI